MRVLCSFLVAVLVILMSQLVAAKSICVPISNNGTTINPSDIFPSLLDGMTNRGRGDYFMYISPCTSTIAYGGIGCPTGTGYIGIANITGCVVGFDKPLMRPTAISAGSGMQAQYGSTMSGHTKDTVSIQILCDPTGNSTLTSKSHKFATMSPNKLGGTAYMLIAYSSVACGSRPNPPTPTLPPKPTLPPTPTGPAKSCRNSVVIGGQTVKPGSWAPQALDLVAGFNPNEYTFLFSPCANHPTNLPYLPTCSSLGYITQFSAESCMAWSFDTITDFSAGDGAINISYTSSGKSGVSAQVSVTCLQGAPVLTSPGGIFTNNSGVFQFELGIQDLCGGQTWAPWTAPPKPASLSSSSSHGGSHGSNSFPSMSGSGSSGMPSGSGSGMVPSGGSGSSGMPSGGSMSSDMPSGGSSDMPMPSGDSSSGMPSGDSMSSDMPSGDSMSSDMPSGGSSDSGMPSGDSMSDSGMPPMPSDDSGMPSSM